MKVVQQHIVESEGQAGVQRKVRCNDVLVPLDPGFQDRESGIVPV